MTTRYELGEGFDASEGHMTGTEVARAYRVDPKTVTRWAKTGKIPHVKTPGGHYRFSRAWHRRNLAAGA